MNITAEFQLPIMIKTNVGNHNLPLVTDGLKPIC